ncbi:glucuronoyl esterase [Obba rivulosa]|uniref:(4-O-methyl)-D-glucuronate--lignin esterase n=1 Tax=Obba rivulosa TaxID=1052685 RepID=A0A8E2AKK4_9APHY|nr:glucuronoyl esterase [Obba rivulosa]
MKFCAALQLGLALTLLQSVRALTLPTPSASCSTPSTIPFDVSALPDPFTFDDGRPVRTVEDWACRRAQISTLILSYEAGALPSRPEHLSATFSRVNESATLNITAGTGGKSISFAPTITYPSGATPLGGWPLVIAYEGGSIPIPSGIATMFFDNSAMAEQNDLTSRGVGQFYDLYGTNATASAMTAWVWAVSRIIDMLETMPEAQINTQKLAVTGCSRDGKGALMAGAFEPRIALTIPQESGSGGDACWRLSLWEQENGSVVQTATEIVGENVWFSENFANYVNNLSSLPFDHHLLAGMVAPRGMISYENTDLAWLSPLSNFGCMTAAHTVYEALGIPQNHGFEQIGGHEHCAWPANLTASLDAFFNKFLLNEDVDTTFFATNDVFYNVTWNAAQWITWTTPKLSLI